MKRLAASLAALLILFQPAANAQSGNIEIVQIPIITIEPHILEEIDDHCGDNITYTITSGELRLSGSGDMYNFTPHDAPWYERAAEITSITIDSGISFIGNYAFENCSSAKSVSIPDTVTQIGYDAFYGCSSLETITIPEDVTIIGSSAFLGCSKLRSIDLPDGLENIYNYTFAMCSSLSEISVGKNVRSIDEGAFHGCRSLSNVYYAGSASEWNSIDIGRSNSCLTDANIIYGDTAADEPENTSPSTDNEQAEPEGDVSGDDDVSGDKPPAAGADDDTVKEDAYDNSDENSTLDDPDEEIVYEDESEGNNDQEYEENEDSDDQNEYYNDEYYDDEYYDDEYYDESEETYAETFQCSDWALGEITDAYELSLIPELMISEDLTKTVTREKFAAIAVYLYLNMTGEEYPEYEISSTPFTDCYFRESEYLGYIAAAYKLGLINGISADEFAPDDPISRQDLAVMLGRAVKKIMYPGWTIASDTEYPFDTSDAPVFADDKDISDYAKQSVYFMAKHGIVKGIDNTHFAPQNITYEQKVSGYATSTKEQAILISLRCYNYLMNN